MAGDARLLPNLMDSKSVGGVTLQTSAADVRTSGTVGLKATGTVTVGGTVAEGDVITVTVKGKSVNYALTSGDTTTTLTAVSLAAAINADPEISKYVFATSSGAVVTLSAVKPGLIGNAVTLTSSSTGTTTATAGAATLASGTGNLITPLEDFSISINGVMLKFRQGRPVIATTDLRLAVAAANVAVI